MTAATLSNPRCRVLVMAGGTGGHVFPGLVVAQRLQAANVDVSWLGTRRGIESKLVPDSGIPLNYLSVEGLRGRGLLALLKAPVMLLQSLVQAWLILSEIKPQVVLGMGGFASGPGAVAARIRRIPLVIHEQNSVAGTTNRILAKMAAKVLQGFPNSLPEAECCGNPVRAEIAAIEAPQVRLAERRAPVKMLVLGGSRGALALNKLIPQALAQLQPEERPQVLHQTGAAHFEATDKIYREQNFGDCDRQLERVAFIDRIEQAYAWADFVICRSGALTVAELSSAGLASLLIPFPYAIDDHQTTNGELLVNCGAARLVQERDLSAQSLTEQIRYFCQSPQRRLSMGVAARSLAKNGAAERVAAVCMEVACGN